MSIYTTPLSQLGTKDLQELLNDGAVENARLEFKLVDPNKVKTEYADLKSDNTKLRSEINTTKTISY